jgi:hypothetical protein
VELVARDLADEATDALPDDLSGTERLMPTAAIIAIWPLFIRRRLALALQISASAA